MNNQPSDKKEKEATVKKENQDLPNISSSTEKLHNEKNVKKQIKESSKINDEGKTDNTEQNSEN